MSFLWTINLTEELRFSPSLSKDRFKDSHERFGELVLQVILRVDWDVVLQHINRILNGNKRHDINNIYTCFKRLKLVHFLRNLENTKLSIPFRQYFNGKCHKTSMPICVCQTVFITAKKFLSIKYRQEKSEHRCSCSFEDTVMTNIIFSACMRGFWSINWR